MRSGPQPSTGNPYPLPSAIRSQMEHVFRTSFSDVTCEIGPEPSALGARAFAFGSRLFFAPGAFDPGSKAGCALVAHELSHVVQQRSKKLRDGYPQRTGLLYEHSLEQEADAMAEEAVRSWKPSAVRPQRPPIDALRLGRPLEVCEGSYQIAADIGERLAGSVIVHQGSRSAIEITDLKVLPEFRGRGLGRLLIHSALQTGICLAKRYAVLVSGDSGSGRLSRWYQGLGFQKSGLQKGYPEYAARIARALFGVACFTPPPLSGQLIQCMEDNEAKRLMRAQRFGIDPTAQAQQQAAQEDYKQRLRQLVWNALWLLQRGGPIMDEARSAAKHGDRNPSHTFGEALNSALSRSEWGKIEAEQDQGGDTVITIKLGGKDTVTAVHVVRQGYLKVIHSGPTATGVGYGTNLGD